MTITELRARLDALENARRATARARRRRNVWGNLLAGGLLALSAVLCAAAYALAVTPVH